MLHTRREAMHLLYVEDSTTDAELTRLSLSRNAPEIRLDIADGLQAALERLAGAEYDLILSDLSFPDGSGFDLLRILQQQQRTTPVVIVTGHDDLGAAVTALRAGACDFIAKRSDYLKQLPQRLREALRPARRRMERGLLVLYLDSNLAALDRTVRFMASNAPWIEVRGFHTADALLKALLAQPTASGAEHPLPEIVLLGDHGHREIERLELIRQIRALTAPPLPVVLLVSGYDEQLAALASHLEVADLVARNDNYLHSLPAMLDKVRHQYELRRERDALQALNERYASLLESSPTLLFKLRINDGHRMPAWVSENVERMLGYTMEEVLAEHWWWRNLFEGDRARISALQNIAPDQDEIELRYRFHHRDGSLLWVRDHQRFVRNREGEVTEIIGTWTDALDEALGTAVRDLRLEVRERMSEGQKLSSLLALIEARLESCYFGCHAAVLITDASADFPVQDRAQDEGVARDAAIDTLSCFRAAATTHWLPAALRGLDPKRPLHVTLEEPPATTPDGQHWQDLLHRSGCAHGWFMRLNGPGDRPLGLLALLADTPCTSARALRRLPDFALVAGLTIERYTSVQVQRLFYTSVSNTRDGVVITDNSPAIVFVNEAWCEITGYTREEALGHNPSMLKSGIESPERYQALWHGLLTQGNWRGEIWNRRKNGETYPQLLSITAVHDADGQPTHYVGVTTDLSRLRQSEEERERLTHFDPLTHLPNRLLAQSRLEHAIEQAQRTHQRIAVLQIDLDHFKRINDSLGHYAGDQLLVTMAHRLQHNVNGHGTVARLGGDEFLIIVEALALPDDAARLARDLIENLREPVDLLDTHHAFTSASVGISLYPEDGEDAQSLIQHADTALNAAKERGRDQYCFYTEELSAAVRQRLTLENELRVALQRGELSLHYQPQVDIRSGRINGIEALMRWHSPTLGTVSPATFIPVAEQSGLIFPLGTWAMEEACRQNKQWQDRGLPALCMAVNVSLRQFRAPDFVSIVSDIIARTALPAHCLEVEITESAFIDDAEAAIETCAQLHRLGVRLALDDFGTGYSSLAYLSRFPFDKIKIDQSFVQDITSNPTNAAIARTTIALADSLHTSVLAEGVENDSQLNFLRERGCASMQGYLFSRPLKAEDFETLLLEARSLPPPESGPDEAPVRGLLLLDDEPNILRALQRLLRQEGYRVHATTSPHEAFDILARNPVQVIVSDQRMPEMSGTEFLSRVKELHPDTIRIVLSGFSEADAITEAVNRGAIYKFFTKPWDDQVLRQELRDAFRVAEKLRKP